jgi:predicted protein tyrosine phosphatase
MVDYSQITEHIFIGNVYSAIGNYKTMEKDILDVLDIKVVISALTEEEYEDYMITGEDFPNLEWHRFVINDDKDERISDYFINTHFIINRALSKSQKVFVHCLGGISRSSTLIIAYLMIENKWTYQKAYTYVKQRRNSIDPNVGFVNQLKQLEQS